VNIRLFLTFLWLNQLLEVSNGKSNKRYEKQKLYSQFCTNLVSSMTEKVEYLNGLRGLAALGVVFSHLFGTLLPVMVEGINGPYAAIPHLGNYEALLYWSPLNFLYGGNIAVSIFFVLSGYVLTYRFFLNGGDKKHIKASAFRRYPRLMIPVFFSMLLMYFVISLGFGYNNTAAQITGSQWLGSYDTKTANIFMTLFSGLIGVFVANKWYINPPLWTMTTEFFGSFLVFGLCLLLGNRRNRRFLYAIGLLLFFGTFILIGDRKYPWVIHAIGVVLSLSKQYVCFLIGMILADLYNSQGKEKYEIKNPISIFCLFILGLIFASYLDGNNYASFLPRLMGSNTQWFYHTMGAGIILCCLVNSRSLQKFFSSKVPRFLGRISFSMYITHIIIVFSLSCWLIVKLYPIVPYPWMVLIVIAISFPLILLVGYIGTIFIDEPGVEFSHWLYNLVF
jgi:peptidoglycan/LPS O-acetylase OafA/YrhL